MTNKTVKAAVVLGVAIGWMGLSKTAAAQVETQPVEESSAPPQLPAPAATTTPATTTPATPAALTTAPESAEAPPKTMTVVLPRHRFEATGRVGVIGGGILTPKGLSEGHTQPSWIGALDMDMITLPFNPFFTVGSYVQFTNAGYERFSGGKQLNRDGNMTLVSFGASAKARLPITQGVAAKAGVYLGYNHLNFSVIEDGKTIGASGGGLNVAFSGELVIDVSRSVAINLQASFISQVSGGVTVEGDSKDHDLAMTPKPFITVGPEFHF